MGDMFRSEEMVLCQLFIQPEAAYPSLTELGEVGCAQFRDLNEGVNLFQRKFVTEVRRCDELERKIRYIKGELKKENIVLPETADEIPKAPNPKEIIDLEAHLEKTENEILELAQNEVNLRSNYLELSELSQVLKSVEYIFSDDDIHLSSSRAQILADDIMNQPNGSLSFIAGVIRRERMFSFERMLWRISRGNVFVKHSDYRVLKDDSAADYPVYNTVFVAFFQGEQLKNRIKKVCAGYHASVYPCPSSHVERQQMAGEVHTRLLDLTLVLNQTKDHRHRVLVTVSRNLPSWIIMVKKMKAIYHTLNLFNLDVSKKCLIGECWVPAQDLSVVKSILSDGSASVGSSIPSFMNIIHTNNAPPTYNRTNKFTRGFQNLIDAYGIASYREANPGLHTIITFPFLFAVMFGDMGHGLIMFLFGAWMCLWEGSLSKKRGGEIWNIFFGGRYIILLMGLFSMFTGFIYNDMFSRSLNIFGSKWHVNYDKSTVLGNKFLQLDPKYDTEGTYPMGLDPIWQLAENKIIFLNSFKMKLSIIFGVTHMLFGVCMSVVNFCHFRKFFRISMEFLPQVLFLLLLFGHMVFLMFFKWIKYSAKADYKESPQCAPSVLIMFINMMLFKAPTPSKDCDDYMFSSQDLLQIQNVFISLACIPWMLLAKPLYLMKTRGRQGYVFRLHGQEEETEETGDTVSTTSVRQNGENTPPGPAVSHGGDGNDAHIIKDEPMSEIFIHQAIHTIEYVLSTISHTASYLRLWALSLAHAQLSEVLWNMVMRVGFGLPNFYPIILFFTFAAWALFTVAILVMMEGLSAFLHTLRLHWVEFMSKFYEGLGYAFEPFCFKNILEEEEVD